MYSLKGMSGDEVREELEIVKHNLQSYAKLYPDIMAVNKNIRSFIVKLYQYYWKLKKEARYR